MSGVSGQPSFEDELVELLERRAKRSKVDPGLVGRVAAQASESRQDRTGWWGAAARSFTPARRMAASLVAIVAVVSLVGGALLVGGGSRPSASPSPSPSASGLVAGPTELTAYRFASADFLRYLREQPDAFVGHTILVDGTLTDAGDCYRPSFDCPPMQFHGADLGDPTVRPADQQARDSVGAGATGTFAIRVESADRLTTLGLVRLPDADQAWRPSELRPNNGRAANLYAVDGYLGAASGVGCPLVGGEPNFCPPAWISDAPATGSSASDIPAGAIRIPAYVAKTRGAPALQPRVEAVVRSAVGGPCVAGCEALTNGNAWTVVAVLEPVTLSVPASPPPSEVAQSEPNVLDAASLPGYLAHASPGSTILVRGTLVPMTWCKGADCPPATFNGVARADAVRVLRGGDMVAPPVAGTFAVEVVDATSVRYVATVVPNGDHVSWRPLELGRYGPPPGTAYVVTGWLVPGESPTCPVATDGTPVCDLRPPQLVEDEVAARQLFTGQKVESLILRDVADRVLDLGNPGTNPEQGTYVVRRFEVPMCGPTADCYGGVGLAYGVDARIQYVVAVPNPPPPDAQPRAEP